MHRDETPFDQIPCQPVALRSTSTDRPASGAAARNAGRVDSAGIAQFNPVVTRSLLPCPQMQSGDVGGDFHRSLDSALSSNTPSAKISKPTLATALWENSTELSIQPEAQLGDKERCDRADGPIFSGPNGHIRWRRFRPITTRSRTIRALILADLRTSTFPKSCGVTSRSRNGLALRGHAS